MAVFYNFRFARRSNFAGSNSKKYVDMKKLEIFTRKWQFFALLLLAQCLLVPFASRNFSWQDISAIVYTTLGRSFQMSFGHWNILFQALSLLFILLLLLFRNRFARVFHIYVSVSYLSFTFLQNLAVTEQYGFSMVTVNVVMFLLVSFVWIGECFRSTCRYSFVNLRWRYGWMIVLSVFAYLLPFTWDGTLDWNPVHFFYKNSSTSFCLMTPLFLTLMTLNLPQVSIVTYRITALIGVVMGVYNMGSFLNPHTVFLGILHIPLLSISLYATILSYQKKYVKYPLAELIGT